MNRLLIGTYAKPPEILVVSRHFTMTDKIAKTLQHSGYHVTSFTGTDQVWQYLSGEGCDLIMLDADLPGESSFDFCRDLKEYPLFEQIPVVFLLTGHDQQMVRQCYSAGGVDYLISPINEVELQARLQTHLRLKRIFALTERGNSFFQTLLDSLPVAVRAKSAEDGRNWYWNENACRLFGKNSHDITGHTDDEILNPDLLQFLKACDDAALQTQQSVHLQRLVFISQSQGKRVISSTAIPVFDNDGHMLYLLQVSQDITERDRATEELRLNREELSRANATKDKLFSIIAHDLRGPIAGISSLLELLAMGATTPEDAQNMLAELSRSINNVSDLLENLLTWARSQRSDIRINQESLLVQPLLQQTLELYHQQLTGKNQVVTVSIEPDTQVWVDEAMFTTILRNLISNANKFTPNGGSITVTASTSGDYTTVTISDSGVGIKEINLAKLFKLGYKFTTTGTNGEIGTGLGLILVGEFVEKNQGRISVQSQLGQGSTFIVNLPAIQLS